MQKKLAGIVNDKKKWNLLLGIQSMIVFKIDKGILVNNRVTDTITNSHSLQQIKYKIRFHN